MSIALRLDTIERAAKKLTKAEIVALDNLRVGRPWDFQSSRAGGARARMFDRLKSRGLVFGSPIRITDFGCQVLMARLTR